MYCQSTVYIVSLMVVLFGERVFAAKEQWKARINTALSKQVNKKNDKELVLGVALGCGGFGNDQLRVKSL